MTSYRTFALTVLTVLSIALGSFTSTPSMAAESPSDAELFEMRLCATSYLPDVCLNAKKASDWARGITTSRVRSGVFRDGSDGTMANAFLHCTWIGAISVWHGPDTAIGIGALHETANPNPFPLTKMDHFNNITGASIGDEAVRLGVADGWGYVMDECESRAKEGLLYGPCAIQGNYIGDVKAPYLPAEQQTCSPS